MDAGLLLLVVALMVAVLVVVVALRSQRRRERGQPYGYGPGLLGLSNADLGADEPNRESCYMCGRPQRNWRPLCLTCPECQVRYCLRCRGFITVDDNFGGEASPKEYGCRYCGHRWIAYVFYII